MLMLWQSGDDGQQSVHHDNRNGRRAWELSCLSPNIISCRDVSQTREPAGVSF